MGSSWTIDWLGSVGELEVANKYGLRELSPQITESDPTAGTLPPLWIPACYNPPF